MGYSCTGFSYRLSLPFLEDFNSTRTAFISQGDPISRIVVPTCPSGTRATSTSNKLVGTDSTPGQGCSNETSTGRF